MKDKYFGDINDFRKYGLLSGLLKDSGYSLLVAWMLTDDDTSNDGSLRSYKHLRKYDEDLYDGIARLLRNGAPREVRLIEKSGLLPKARFHSEKVPDDKTSRQIWQNGLLEAVSGMDFCFFDPDNGLQVKSKPMGRKHSSKYVFWDEIKMVWERGCTILIYQHLPRKKSEDVAQERASELRNNIGSSSVRVFKAPRVMYFLAMQEKHRRLLETAIENYLRKWDEIEEI